MEPSLFDNKRKRVLAQAIFWACLLGAMNLGFTGMEVPRPFLLRSLFTIALTIALVLLNTYFFVPRFFAQKRYGAFVPAVVLGLAGMILLTPAMEFWILGESVKPIPTIQHMQGRPHMPVPSKIWHNPRHFMELVIYTAVVMLSTVLESVQLHRRQEHLASQIENEKLATELKFLKSQINPHFLFNALNNVYTLSLLKSEQTPEVVMKLSEMLRYMLYESNRDRVSLEQELKYIQNYVALQQLKGDVPLTVKSNMVVDNPQSGIAPMILIPFVENAFKHSKIEDIDHGWINIKLTVTGDRLDFEVSNSLPKTAATSDPTGGIGLQNVRRRLELEYPDRHKLDLSEGNGTFGIHLSIQLE